MGAAPALECALRIPSCLKNSPFTESTPPGSAVTWRGTLNRYGYRQRGRSQVPAEPDECLLPPVSCLKPGPCLLAFFKVEHCLYLLYANDLSLCVGQDVSITQYADDTQVLVSGKKCDLPSLITRMEKALEALFRWFCFNGMNVNAQKTQMIVLGTPSMLRSLPALSLKFNGATVTESRVVKNSGVIFDRSLTFESHIDTMTRQCTGLLIALNHARHVMLHQALKVIVESLVLSIVRYCLSVYGSCGISRVHRIQKIVNFCARVVTGRRRSDHVSDAIKLLGWLTA